MQKVIDFLSDNNQLESSMEQKTLFTVKKKKPKKTKTNSYYNLTHKTLCDLSPLPHLLYLIIFVFLEVKVT